MAAATIRGAEIKAGALRFQAADENIRDLYEDLERLAKEAPPPLKRSGLPGRYLTTDRGAGCGLPFLF